jgi:hypothetical protein
VKKRSQAARCNFSGAENQGTAPSTAYTRRACYALANTPATIVATTVATIVVISNVVGSLTVIASGAAKARLCRRFFFAPDGAHKLSVAIERPQ